MFLKNSPEPAPQIPNALEIDEKKYNIDVEKTAKSYFTKGLDTGPNNISAWFPEGEVIALDQVNAALSAAWVAKEAGGNAAGRLTIQDRNFIEFIAQRIEQQKKTGKAKEQAEATHLQDQKERFEKTYNIDIRMTAQEYFWRRLDTGPNKIEDNWFRGTVVDTAAVNATLTPIWKELEVGPNKKGILAPEDKEFIEFLAKEIVAYGPQFKKNVTENVEQEQKKMENELIEYRNDLRLEWGRVQKYFSSGTLVVADTDFAPYLLGFSPDSTTFEFTEKNELETVDFEKVQKLLSALEAEIRRKQLELKTSHFASRSAEQIQQDITELKEVAHYLGGQFSDWGGVMGFLRIQQKKEVLNTYFGANAVPQTAEKIREEIKKAEEERDRLQEEKEALIEERRLEESKDLPRPDYAKVQKLEYDISQKQYRINQLGGEIASLNKVLGIRTFELDDPRQGIFATIRDVVTSESKERRNEATEKLLNTWEKEKNISFSSTINTYFERNLDVAEGAKDSVETWFDPHGQPKIQEIYETLSQCWVTPDKSPLHRIGQAGNQIQVEAKEGAQPVVIGAGDELFIKTLASQIRETRNLRQQRDVGGIHAEEYESAEDMLEKGIEGFKDMLQSGDPVQAGSAVLLLFVGLKSLFSGGDGAGKYLKYGIFAVAAHKFVKETYGFDALAALHVKTPEELFQGTYFQAQLDLWDRNKEKLQLDPHSRAQKALESPYQASLLKEMNDIEAQELIEWHKDAYPDLLKNADTNEVKKIICRKMPKGLQVAISNVHSTDSRGPEGWELALQGFGLLEVFFQNTAYERGDEATPDIITGRNIIENTFVPELAARKNKTREEILLGDLFQDMTDAHELGMSTDMDKTIFDYTATASVRLWKEAGWPLMKDAYNWSKERLEKYAEKIKTDWGPEIFKFAEYLKTKGMDVVEIVEDKIVVWYHGNKVEIKKAASGLGHIFVDSLELSVKPILFVAQKAGEIGNQHLIPDAAHRVVAELEQHRQERFATSETVFDTGVSSGSILNGDPLPPEKIEASVGTLFYPMFQTEAENMTTRTFGPGELYYDTSRDPNALYVVIDFREEDLPQDLAHDKSELKKQPRLNYAISNAPEKARKMIASRWNPGLWNNDWDTPPKPDDEDMKYVDPVYANQEVVRDGLKVYLRVPLPQSAEYKRRESDEFEFTSGQMKNQTLYPRGTSLKTVLEGYPLIERQIIENYNFLRSEDYVKFLTKFERTHGDFITIEQALIALAPRFSEQAMAEIPLTDWKPLRELGQSELAEEVIEEDKDNMDPKSIWTKEKYYEKVAEVIDATLEGGVFLSWDTTSSPPKTISNKNPEAATLFDKAQLTDNGDTYRPRLMHFFQLLEFHLRDKEYKTNPSKILNTDGWEYNLADEVTTLVDEANRIDPATPLKDLGDATEEIIKDTVDGTIDRGERVGSGLKGGIIQIIQEIKK